MHIICRFWKKFDLGNIDNKLRTPEENNRRRRAEDLKCLHRLRATPDIINKVINIKTDENIRQGDPISPKLFTSVYFTDKRIDR